MIIELRQSQTHGPYFFCEPEESEMLSKVFSDVGLEYTCNSAGELSFIPKGKTAFTFGEATREDVADVVRDEGVEVIFLEPAPPIYLPPVAAILELPAAPAETTISRKAPFEELGPEGTT